MTKTVATSRSHRRLLVLDRPAECALLFICERSGLSFSEAARLGLRLAAERLGYPSPIVITDGESKPETKR